MPSSDVVPVFERCGNTFFWKPVEQTNDDLKVTFVDPVGMVVVQSSREGDQLLVMRGWFDEPYEGVFQAIHDALPTDESVKLNIWLRTILAAVRTSKKVKVIGHFADMVPEAQRSIISGILHWLGRNVRGWKAESRVVRADAGELWEVLNDYGVHEC